MKLSLISILNDKGQDTVFSLILVPIRSGLRGFCLFIVVNSQWTIGKKSRSNTMSCPHGIINGYKCFFWVSSAKIELTSWGKKFQ